MVLKPNDSQLVNWRKYKDESKLSEECHLHMMHISSQMGKGINKVKRK